MTNHRTMNRLIRICSIYKLNIKIFKLKKLFKQICYWDFTVITKWYKEIAHNEIIIIECHGKKNDKQKIYVNNDVIHMIIIC